MIKTMDLVGLGGGLGSLLRYGTILLINMHFLHLFPLATFSVNVLSCFRIGLLLGFFDRYSWTDSDLNLVSVVGFCGGYTAFSTFSMDKHPFVTVGTPVLGIDLCDIERSDMVNSCPGWALFYEVTPKKITGEK